MSDRSNREALGEFIRAQRRLANMSLRQMAEVAKVSNAYLSQLERGQHEPSIHVIRSIAAALDLSAETLLTHAGWMEPPGTKGEAGTEEAIRHDGQLTDEQKLALLAVYRSYVQANDRSSRTDR